MQLPVHSFDEKSGDYKPATKPKLMPACQMEAQEDMVVSSVSEEVRQAQATVQEFLLLNHPVDCPICDQAGECKLQDYWYEHQHELKRKRTEPVHKPKAQRFGPHIVYDAERCIMCTRCIRVCDEVAKEHVLDKRERGNRSEIVLAPGKTLDHDYSLMTEHVCPVGALTSADFRFKARVWFLKSAKGICQGCSKGCNSYVDYDPRNNRVYRLRPRDNMNVNEFWMCDQGMMSYEQTHQDRVLAATIGDRDNRAVIGYDDAVAKLVEHLQDVESKHVGIVLSHTSSCEDNAALLQLAEKAGWSNVYVAERHDSSWHADDVLKEADCNPNRVGVNQIAKDAMPIDALVTDIASGDVQSLIMLGTDAHVGDKVRESIESLEYVCVLASNRTEIAEMASLLLPAAHWAEMSATYVNSQRHATNVATSDLPACWHRASLANRGSDWQSTRECRFALANIGRFACQYVSSIRVGSNYGRLTRKEFRMLLEIIASVLKIVFVLAVVVGAFAPVLVWAERRQSAMMQDRIGPTRAGIVLPEGLVELMRTSIAPLKFGSMVMAMLGTALLAIITLNAMYYFAQLGSTPAGPGWTIFGVEAKMLYWCCILEFCPRRSGSSWR